MLYNPNVPQKFASFPNHSQKGWICKFFSKQEPNQRHTWTEKIELEFFLAFPRNLWTSPYLSRNSLDSILITRWGARDSGILTLFPDPHRKYSFAGQNEWIITSILGSAVCKLYSRLTLAFRDNKDNINFVVSPFFFVATYLPAVWYKATRAAIEPTVEASTWKGNNKGTSNSWTSI